MEKKKVKQVQSNTVYLYDSVENNNVKQKSLILIRFVIFLRMDRHLPSLQNVLFNEHADYPKKKSCLEPSLINDQRL